MKKSLLSLNLPATALFGAAALISTASAQLVYEQTFESLTAGDLNGQAGFITNANTVDVSSPGVSYSAGSVSVPGGAQAASIGNNPDNRAINSFTAQTGDVYFSASIAFTQLANVDFFQFVLGPSNTVTADFFNGTTLGFVFRDNRRIQPRFTVAGTPSTLTAGTPQLPDNDSGTFTGSLLLVGKLSKSGAFGSNYDTIDMFLNPTTLTEPTATVSYTGINSGISSVSGFGFRTGADAPTSSSIDNIRIGTQWDTVVIPEPSSMALLAGAGVAFWALRRRRG